MFHKRLVSPLFYTAPCNHFGTVTNIVTHIGLGFSDSSFRTLGRILTCNLLLRRELFYTVELRGHIVGREGFEPPMLLIKRADLQSASFNHLDTCPKKLSLVCESSNFSVGYHLCIAGLPAIAF